MSKKPERAAHIQPVPNVAPGEVERIVARDFAPREREAVMRLLCEYGTEPWHREQDRVRLAILKLAAGRLDKLRAHLETAKKDFRDVIAYAEYPAYMDTVQPSESGSAAAHEAILGDQEQYEAWRRRP